MSTHRQRILQARLCSQVYLGPQTSEKDLRQALRPFRKVASVFRNTIARQTRMWVANSGFGWTKDRMSSLIQYCLKTRAGEVALKPTWMREEFIVYPERVSKSGSDEQFVELIQVLRVYTRMGQSVKSATISDFEKFFKAVTGPSQGAGWKVKPRTLGSTVEIGQMDLHSVFQSIRRASGAEPDPLVGTRKWFSRSLAGLYKFKTIEVPNLLALDGREFEEMVSGLMYVPTIQRHYGKRSSGRNRLPLNAHPFQSMIRLDQIYLTQHRPDGSSGHIHHRIQADGKVRYFFAPHQWVQFLQYPYAKELYRKLKQNKNDFTFDQDAGVRKVQEMIRTGKICHSIDLSSATDRFPLSFTYLCLCAINRTANGFNWANLFAQTSRLPARIDNPEGGSTLLRWEVGQPLGTIMSFAAFAISHHCLVHLIANAVGKSGFQDYAILGDDIVIADDQIAQGYRHFLTSFGVEISEQKSVRSDSLGEFGGRVILPDYLGFKLKYGRSEYRTLNAQIDLLGAKAIRMHPQTRMRDVLSLLPLGNSPGFNPGGFPDSKVSAFIASYYSYDKDHTEDLSNSYTIPSHAVKTRAEVLSALHYHGHNHPLPSAPKGARHVDQFGSPCPGPQRGKGGTRNEFRVSPYMSRSWLTRVTRLARDAGLLD